MEKKAELRIAKLRRLLARNGGYILRKYRNELLFSIDDHLGDRVKVGADEKTNYLTFEDVDAFITYTIEKLKKKKELHIKGKFND